MKMSTFRMALDLMALAVLTISAFMVGSNYFNYLFPLLASFVGLLWSLLKLHRRSAA